MSPASTSLFGIPPVQLAARVLIDGLSEMVLDYAIPAHMEGIQRGCRVEVLMRNRRLTATVLELVRPDPNWADKLKPLLSLISPEPVISEDLLKLAQWASHYYLVPIEQMVRCLVPSSVRQEKHQEKTKKLISLSQWPDDETLNQINARAPRQALILRLLHQADERQEFLSELGGSSALAPCRALEKRGFISITDQSIHRDPAGDELFAQTRPLTLNDQQDQVLQSILSSINEQKSQPILLQGITGSGKTEVYLQAAAHVLAQGKGVLILVPEISLTPQTMARFKGRFADDPKSVAILHSGMSDGERFDEWHSLQKGIARIAIGPRSALFAPVQNLGLIIVDEEHDASYKQETSPRYQGRDLAVLRASIEKACIVLGSATPSLESLHNVRQGKYRLLRIDKRADGQQLPLTRVLDMRSEPKDKRYLGILCERLRIAIDQRLERQEQTILLLNRRGFARSLQCPDCQTNVECEHCSVPLTYHITENRLICHVCGYRAVVPRVCPHCQSAKILLEGFGTQKVESVLKRCFPQARIRRIDADVTSRKNALRDILADFRAGKIDILLGTQMISKGLDFPRVTLVGVLNADQGLNMPDLRAAERTFQLLTQVAGRAGRGEIEGEVMIQTYAPHAPAIQYARRHDSDGFSACELDLRAQFAHPPFTHMALITVRAESESLGEFVMMSLHKKLAAALPLGASISEPMPAPLAKSHGQFRFQCTLKSPHARLLGDICRQEIDKIKAAEGISIIFDMDAYSLS